MTAQQCSPWQWRKGQGLLTGLPLGFGSPHARYTCQTQGAGPAWACIGTKVCGLNVQKTSVSRKGDIYELDIFSEVCPAPWMP